MEIKDSMFDKYNFQNFISEKITQEPEMVSAAISGILSGVQEVVRKAQIKANSAQLVICAVSDKEMDRVMNRLNPQVIKDLGITSKNYPGWDALKDWEKKQKVK